MSWNHFGSCHKKTSILMTLLPGGLVGAPSFPTCLFMLVISLQSQAIKILLIVVIVANHTIIGSAVAVECIFSGGQDIISLCHTRLKLDTIPTLTLVRQRLHLAHNAAQDIVGS